MKKLFLAICMVLISASSFAQQGKSTLGVHGNYMIDSPNNLGLGANYGYEFAENLRGVAEFDYFFKKDYVSFWNAGANVEYLFKLADGKMIFYPMAGLDVLGISWENGGSDSKLGLNLGVGFEYPVSSSLSLKLEYNYKTEYDGFSVLKFGVVVPL